MTTGIGYLFSGQGAQAVGMGRDLAERDPEARALYQRAGEAVGFDLARVSFEGPEDELTRTDICQPAIVVASLAALGILRRLRPAQEPTVCAGLSLGEYSALVAAGALDAMDAVRLVAARGRYMQEACDARPGAMASVLGMKPADVEAAVAEVHTDAAPVVVSNYNSPKQVVISGEAGAVERARELLAERGARRVLALNVAGAYHSPLMAPAAERLAHDLEGVEVCAPGVEVLSNVTAQPHTTPDEIRRLLAEQVCSPVRWTSSLERMVGAGVATFYELGPGRVLAGTLRQVDRKAVCHPLMGLEDFGKAGIEWPA
jgi:[acyl-carrier-protein] S-malonyltransferase